MEKNQIPAKAVGLGLRAPHYEEVVQNKPKVPWFEVHSENYFDECGLNRHFLREIAPHYPLSFHGVGLSLGSCDELSSHHLKQLKALINEFQPALISEHLSWTGTNGQFFNDLLPLPYTEEALNLFCQKVDCVQTELGQKILIENPTAYLQFAVSHMKEWEFLNQLQARTGCGLLLDLNNIYVNASNHDDSAATYLESINWSAVEEIHLAGFTVNEYKDGAILIDTHGSRVHDEVWALYRQATIQTEAPVLIEWDTDIPDLTVLEEEAAKARQINAAIQQVAAWA